MDFITNVQSTAEWRRRKERQFPNDTRNAEAALTLEMFACELGDMYALNNAPDERLEKYDPFEVSRVISDELKKVGFHSFPKKVSDLLDAIEQELKRYATEPAE